MRLRPAGVADLELILHQRREMFREMGGDYERGLDAFESASRTYLITALNNGSYHGLLGEQNNEVVGGGGVLLAAWPGSPLNLEPRRAWILNIYVEPSFRRRGFARTIIESLIRWCRNEGFQSVALHASEHGRSLYESLGFRSTNEMRLRI
ncbi:MAG: GNAT family N-acetyltransferase [Bryobacteraceae bacterium]